MNSSRLQFLFALLAGALFGLGLAVSQMINPAKVIGFLDVSGRWDPENRSLSSCSARWRSPDSLFA